MKNWIWNELLTYILFNQTDLLLLWCPSRFMFLRGPWFCDLISSCRWLSYDYHWHEKKVQFLEKFFVSSTWSPVWLVWRHAKTSFIFVFFSPRKWLKNFVWSAVNVTREKFGWGRGRSGLGFGASSWLSRRQFLVLMIWLGVATHFKS